MCPPELESGASNLQNWHSSNCNYGHSGRKLGIEPNHLPSQGRMLFPLHYKRSIEPGRFELPSPDSKSCMIDHYTTVLHGSSRTRTYGSPVNSRELHQLSYRSSRVWCGSNARPPDFFGMFWRLGEHTLKVRHSSKLSYRPIYIIWILIIFKRCGQVDRIIQDPD